MARRILIVEDNPVNQKVLQYLITGQGFQCDIAADGTKALESMKSNTYVLIFMDLRMPVMDGFEATKAIRENGCSLPIIAITASEQDDDRQRCLDVGMNGYLTKPFNKRDFDDVIHRWLL